MTQELLLLSSSNDLSGWALKLAVRLEREFKQPLLLKLMDCSRLHANALIAALGQFETQQKSKKIDQQQFAGALCDLSTKGLIEFAFGPVPVGFLGLLARLRGRPLPPDCYGNLYDLFAERHPRARALQQTAGVISSSSVMFALHVDDVAVHPSTIGMLLRLSSADDLNSALRLIRQACSSATDERLSMSLGSLSRNQSLSDWANRWLTRSMDRLPHPPPFESDDDFAVLSTGSEMVEVGRQFRNCLNRQVRSVAVGQLLYAVSRSSTVVVEFSRSNAGWVATGAWGPGNAPPSDARWAAVRAMLARHQIVALMGPNTAESQMLRFLGVYERREGISFDTSDDDLPDSIFNFEGDMHEDV